MAKKKSKKEEKTEDFDIDKALEDVSPFLREGFAFYIFDNGLDVKSQKDFDDLLKHYGGL